MSDDRSQSGDQPGKPEEQANTAPASREAAAADSGYAGLPASASPSDAASQDTVPLSSPPVPATPPKQKMRQLAVAAVIAGALVGAGAVGIPVALLTRGTHASPVTGASPTPAPTTAAAAQAKAIYEQALAATRGSAGFHYVATTTGVEAQNIAGDAGRSDGRQVITFGSTFGTEQFTLLLVGGAVYFQGNAPALEDQLGVPTANAPNLQGKWMFVSPGDGPYTILEAGITVADQAQETALVPSSATQVTTADGTPVTRILGTIPPRQGAPAATAHLDIDRTSRLPISYESTLSSGGATLTSTTTFTGWGTAPSVAAPSGAVAWSTPGASEPPGGYGSGGGNSAPTPTPQATL